MMLKITALAAMALVFAGSAAAADVQGIWLSPSRSAHIQIARCGEAVCGRLVSASKPKSNPLFLDIHNKDPSLRSRSMIGQVLLEGFTGGPTRWIGGRVYNPGDGNTYSGAITLIDDDHLKLEGCAVWILCKAQVWTRLEYSTAARTTP